MITDDGKRLHYLAVTSLSVLLREISLSNNGDFYCLNCFHSYLTHNKLKKHGRVCNNHDYCRVDMPKEHEKTNCTPEKNSLTAPFIIYADLECLVKKVQSCQYNPENSYTKKKVSINLWDMHGVHYARLIRQKKPIFIGEKIVLKNPVKI